MNVADTIRLLYAERCSMPEIAAAVDWTEWNVVRFIRFWLEDAR